MKKKLLVIVVLLSLFISMVPGSIFAATIGVEKEVKVAKTFGKSKLKYKKPTKAQIRQVGSELEYYKQSIFETIEDIYSVTYDTEYNESIKQIIDEYYNELETEINSIDNLDDLLLGTAYFLGIPMPDFTEEVYTKVYALEVLVKWDKKVVKGNEDINELKADIKDTVNNGMNCYNESSDYNDYYKSIANGGKQELLSELKTVNDFKTLAMYISKVAYETEYFYPDVSINLDIKNSSYSCPYNDDYSYYDDEEYDDSYYDEDEFNYEDFLEYLGMVNIPELELEGKVFSNEQIKDLKTYTTFYLDAYVNKQLKAANYTTDIGSIKTEVNNAIDTINKSYNIDEIATIYENVLNRLINKTGVEYKNLTSAKYNKLTAEIKKLQNVYLDDEIYSENGIYINEEIFSNVAQILDNVFKDIEIPDDFIQKVEAKLKETKTYAQELKELKQELIKDLNRFKNNKKYNQTKVVPIINEAVKKINASSDMEEIYDLYYDYYAKAEKTINKYMITTKKVGKGTITKSKTVTYGGNFTVKMTPKKGYKIKSVTVDGKKVKNKTKYTFKKVVKAHTIKVVFVKKK